MGFRCSFVAPASNEVRVPIRRRLGASNDTEQATLSKYRLRVLKVLYQTVNSERQSQDAQNFLSI